MPRMLLFAGLCTMLTVMFPGVDSSAQDDVGFTIQRDSAFVTISMDGRPVMNYRFGDAPPKPYVKELWTPRGVQILRDSPHDHVHHRGAMFGIFVNGIDFWSERPEHGKQIDMELTAKTTAGEGGVPVCRLDEQLNWTLHDGTPLLREKRTLEVCRPDESKVTLLTWRTCLELANGGESAQLTGSHYDGLGLRFVESMDGVGRFEYSSGEPGPIVRGTERVTSCKWSAYVAPADGNLVTVALFDHPDNPRHPAGMFTMLKTFAYLSITPNIWKAPVELKSDQTLALDYGLAVWDGEATDAEIETLYQGWVDLVGRRR